MRPPHQDGPPAEAIARLAGSVRAAGWAGFWWGFAEGTVFFIVPDVYISYATLFSPLAGAVAWLASIGGSLLGMVVVWLVMVGAGWDYPAFLTWLPGISAGLLHRVGDTLAAGGLPYTPFLASGGVPLKVYGATAYALGYSAPAVLLWTGFARVVRIAPTFLGVAVVRRLFRPWVHAHPRSSCIVLGGFWITFYGWYFVRMSRN